MSSSSTYQYLFGPVPSRRFGRSLGVDLVPLKTCSLDCIFCEVGATTCRTQERREYVPTNRVIAELEDWLKRGGETDVVTLAGSGEPTLHTGFGDVLRAARRLEQTTVLLSNGTLMPLDEVRRDACSAHIVKLSLSSWDQESYDRLHGSGGAVDFKSVLQSYTVFRKEFAGQLWIEVFLVAGMNDRGDDAARLAELVSRVSPDRIHLNTAVRPTARSGVVAVPAERLAQLAGAFGPTAEVAATFTRAAGPAGMDRPGTVVAIVQRRPCTAAQLAASLGASRDDVLAALETARAEGLVQSVERDGERYFIGTARRQ